MASTHDDNPDQPTAAARLTERLASLGRVAYVASGSLSIREIAAALVDEGMRVLGAHCSLMSVLAEDDTVFVTLCSRGLPRNLAGAFDRYPCDAPIPTADVVRGGEPIFIESAKERRDRYPALARVAAANCRGAVAAVPLVVRDRPIGAIALSFAKSRIFSDDDRSFIQTLAQICAQAIERARLFDATSREIRERRVAEAALQRVQARNNAMIAATLDCLITIDEEDRVVEWNPAAEQTFGHARIDALGRTLSELILPPPLRGAHLRGINRFLATGETVRLNTRAEMTAVRADGTEIDVELTPVPINLGGSYLFTAHLRDITESKRAVAREQAFLRDVLLSVTDGRMTLCFRPEDLPTACSLGPSIQLSQTAGLSELRQAARETAIAIEFPDARWQDLITSVSEAGMNTIMHAGGGTGRVGAHGQTVQVWIEDRGKGIDIEAFPRAAFLRGFSTAGTLGHGIKIILQTIDRFWILTGPEGTTVVLEQDRMRHRHEP